MRRSNEREMGGSRTILLARQTRTIKQCSFDARSKGQSGCSFPLREKWGRFRVIGSHGARLSRSPVQDHRL